MRQDNILHILYDLSITIASEDQHDLLVNKVLMRLMQHTSYPAGMIFRSEDENSSEHLLVASIGDYRIKSYINKYLDIPEKFILNTNGALSDNDLKSWPIRQEYYRSFISLEIPEYGRILLLSSLPDDSQILFSEVFTPILMNFSKTLKLCQESEKFQNSLIADRDDARIKALRFRKALDYSHDLIVLFDPITLKILDFNTTILEILNCRSEDLVNKSFNKITLFKNPPVWEKEILKLLSTGETRFFETDINRHDFVSFPVEVHLSLFTLPDVDSTLAIAVCRNIADRKKVQETLFQEKEKAQVTLHSIGDAVITTDSEGIVDYLNPIAEELTGWSFGFACGRHIQEIFHIVDEISNETVKNPVMECLASGLITAVANHTKLINKKGHEFAIEDSAAPILSREGQIIGAVLVFHDVSSSRELANKLSWQASHDALTGLLNRRELEYRLTHAIESAKNQRLVHTLLFMDLDQFKIVNDTCGHLAGDELLKQISNMLMVHMRESDSFARLGGDEFGVLLNRCNVDHAERVANDIKEAISAFRFVWEGKTFELGVSIGLVPITENTGGLAELIGNADSACYAAKDLGRNRIHIYTDEDEELARRRGEVQWVTKLQRAFETNSFRLYYQPIMPLPNAGRDGLMAEILVRLEDHNGKIILPGAFLPSAERYNLMEKLDRWIIENTFSFLLNNGFPADVEIINLNLSALSVSSNDFLVFMRECFVKYPVPYNQICFEITETSAISNLYVVSNFIYDFRSRGCKIALDDFGSGLSSFGYLKNLDIDYLKIDGTFVKDVMDDAVDETLVQYINQLGHVLGLKTIAEYVESEGIYKKLQEIGVDYAQGFWLGEPAPLR